MSASGRERTPAFDPKRTPLSERTVAKTWPAVRRAASGLLRLHHFYRAPAKVVVIRRNPLQTPGVDAFLSFGSRCDSQETFLVIVLHLGPLPSHAELAANFSKALLHRVVQLLLMRGEQPDRRGKKTVCMEVPFSWEADFLFIIANFHSKTW